MIALVIVAATLMMMVSQGTIFTAMPSPRPLFDAYHERKRVADFAIVADRSHRTQHSINMYTVGQNKQDTLTSPNIGRFSKFFHC